MDQSELDNFEDELHALQYRVEQSIRFFFQSQRDVFLENFRSTNDLRTSMENTVISGTGNSGNSWQIYLTEEPLPFNLFYCLCFLFLVWLTIAVFHIIRRRNEGGRGTPRNSRDISGESNNVGLPPPNSSTEENFIVQNNENENVNGLLLPRNNVNEKEIQDLSNVDVDINELITPLNEEEIKANSVQQLDINYTINELKKEIAKGFKTVLNEIEQWKHETKRETSITKGENNVPDEATEKDIAEKSEPLSTHNKTNCSPKSQKITEIETSDQRKDAANQTEDEVKSKAIENNLINSLTNGHQKESSSSSCDEATITKTLSGYKSDKNKEVDPEEPKDSSSKIAHNEGVKNAKVNTTEVSASEKSSGIKSDDSKEDKDNVEKPKDSKTSNLPKSLNIFATKTSDHHASEALQTKDNNKKDSVQEDPKNGLTPSDQENTKDLSLVVVINEDAKKTIKNIAETVATENISENKNDDIKQGKCNLEKGKKVENIEESNTSPSESKISDSQKSKNTIAAEISDDDKDKVIKTEDEKRKDSIVRDSKDGSVNKDQEKPKDISLLVAKNDDKKNVVETNMEANVKCREDEGDLKINEKNPVKIEESITLSLENKAKISPKSQNDIVVETPDHTDVGLKTEDEGKNDLVRKNSKGDLTNQGNSKDSLTAVPNSEDVKNAIENIKKTSATEKLCENKIIDIKGDDPNIEISKKVNIVEEIKTLPSEIKTNHSPTSQNVTVTETSTINTDKVVKSKDKPKKEDVQKDSTDCVVTEDQNKAEGSSSDTTENEDIKNAIESNKEGTSTEKSILEKDKKAEDIKESKTLLSKNKTCNLPKSQNANISKTFASHTDEVVKTKDEEKNSIENDSNDGLKNKDQGESKDFSSVVAKDENNINTITTEKLNGNKIEDNKRAKVTLLERKSDIGNIVKTKVLPSENKTGNSPKLQNVIVTETSGSHKEEVVKADDKEKKTENMENATENKMEANATEKLSKNKIDGNIENKGNLKEETEISNIKESATLTSENKTSISPQSQNVTKAPDSHADEVVKTQDKEKKDSIPKHLKDDSVKEDQGVIISSATEKISENKNDSCKEDNGAVQKECEVETEKCKALPSENKTSSSPKTQNVSITEKFDHKTEDVKKNSIKRDSENSMETDVTKNTSENKFGEVKENLGEPEKVPKADIIKELALLPSKNKISTSSESQNITVSETLDLHTDEDVVNKNMETGETENPSEKKTLDNTENKDDVQHVKEANIIDESKRLIPATSTFENQEPKIVKSQNVEKELVKVAEKTETNVANEENKKIQSEDSKESSINEDETSTENETGDNKEKECDLGPVNETTNIDKSIILSCESKIDAIPNLQSEIAIKNSNLEENEVVITQNDEKRIEIISNMVEAASDAIEPETNAAANVLNENEIKDDKPEEQNTEASGGIENIDNQEDTFDVDDRHPSSSGSDAEDQATGSSNPNNSSSGNDQLLGGPRKNRKKKKGKKSKHNRY